MARTAVIGLGWGDNGKVSVGERIIINRIFLPPGESYDAVDRFSGGGNAGQHSSKARYIMGSFPDGRPKKDHYVISHLVPYPVWDSNIFKFMGAGTVIIPDGAQEEVEELIANGFDISPRNYGISNRAQVTLWYHLERDGKKEEGGDARGTTRKGISPTFADMATKDGLTMEEFVDQSAFSTFLGEKYGHIRNVLGRPLMRGEIAGMLDHYGPIQDFLRPYIMNEAEFWELHMDKNIIPAGNQGVGLCPIVGTIPHTSSSTPYRLPCNVDFRIGVMKVPPSSVGTRHLVSHMEPPELEEHMRLKKGRDDAEFGSTTGRPRQILWPDTFQTRYEALVANIDCLALTKFDVVSRLAEAGQHTIKICTGYMERGGGRLREFPGNRYLLERCEPIYEELPISGQDISGISSFSDLPSEEQEIVRFLEDKIGAPWLMVTISPSHEGTIINRRLVDEWSPSGADL